MPAAIGIFEITMTEISSPAVTGSIVSQTQDWLNLSETAISRIVAAHGIASAATQCNRIGFRTTTQSYCGNRHRRSPATIEVCANRLSQPLVK